jgi:hypothetical protein
VSWWLPGAGGSGRRRGWAAAPFIRCGARGSSALAAAHSRAAATAAPALGSLFCRDGVAAEDWFRVPAAILPQRGRTARGSSCTLAGQAGLTACAWCVVVEVPAAPVLSHWLLCSCAAPLCLLAGFTLHTAHWLVIVCLGGGDGAFTVSAQPIPYALYRAVNIVHRE